MIPLFIRGLTWPARSASAIGASIRLSALSAATRRTCTSNPADAGPAGARRTRRRDRVEGQPAQTVSPDTFVGDDVLSKAVPSCAAS